MATGADLEANDDFNGDSPLKKVAQQHSPANILALLNAGADVMTRDDNGKTPPHVAAESNAATGVKTIFWRCWPLVRTLWYKIRIDKSLETLPKIMMI